MYEPNLFIVKDEIKDLPRVFGLAVRRYRHQLGLSQEEFATRCQLHRTYLGAIERGERNVTIVTANRIAVALGLRLSEIIGDLERECLGQKSNAEPEDMR